MTKSKMMMSKTERKEINRLRRMKAAFKKTADKAEWVAWVRMQANPLLAVYTRRMREGAMRLRKYLIGNRCKLSNAERVRLLKEMLTVDAPFLSANNHEARIHFYHHWMRHLQLYRQGKNRVHIVTFVADRFVLSFDDAKSFDLLALKAWVNEMMRPYNFDYIGCVEVAHYTMKQEDGGSRFSFHVHVFVFDADLVQLRAMRDAVNCKNTAFLVGRDAVHIKAVKNGNINFLAGYIQKMPEGNYRKFKSRRDDLLDDIDMSDLGLSDDDAEPHPPTEPNDDVDLQAAIKESQVTKIAYPKLELQTRRVTASWHLEKLMVAGGDCKPVMEAIRADALRCLTEAQKRGRQHQHGGTLSHSHNATQPAEGWIRSTVGYRTDEFDRVELEAIAFVERGEGV